MGYTYRGISTFSLGRLFFVEKQTESKKNAPKHTVIRVFFELVEINRKKKSQHVYYMWYIQMNWLHIETDSIYFNLSWAPLHCESERNTTRYEI